jgi:hypothetical protein
LTFTACPGSLAGRDALYVYKLLLLRGHRKEWLLTWDAFPGNFGTKFANAASLARWALLWLARRLDVL